MQSPDLIVFDVDGTLLDEGQEVVERTQAIRALSQRIPCLLSSGRAPLSLNQWASHWGLTGPHAACNGALLTTGPGEVEVLETLDDAVRDGIMASLLTQDIPVLVYAADGTLRSAFKDERLDFVIDFDEPRPIVGGWEDQPAVKIIALADRHSEQSLRQLYAEETLIQRTHEMMLEWNSPKCSKGLALAHQIAKLGVDPTHVLAIGDSENDASMLTLAHHGIAVMGAAIEAKAAADEILTVPIHEWMNNL